MELLLDNLKQGFNRQVALREKRPGILQILAPLFHEDGDMIDMFIDIPKSAGDPIRISDHGLTLMRLSYNCDIETPAKQRVLGRILSENGIAEIDGRFSLETTSDGLYPAILQFAQAIAKVTNIQAFNREVVQSLFYESLGEFVSSSLSAYFPQRDFMPVSERDDLEVDWCFNVHPKRIFLYGVKGTAKARLAALTCREFQLLKIPFRSVIVHENFETGLGQKDQARITNAADKQFVSLSDFKNEAGSYFEREVEMSPLTH